MAVETILYPFTTRDEIERLFGEKAVKLRQEDLQGGDLTLYWTDLIADATTKMQAYLEMYYEPADLANSRWVRVRATWIGAFLLSQRRGNPAQYLSRYQEIMEELQAIAAGILQVPGLPTRADFTPAMNNLIVDDRYALAKLRVHDPISTGGTSGRLHSSFLIHPFEWL